MSVLKYKVVDAAKISVGDPVKKDGVYVSALLYDGAPGLTFQSPDVTIFQDHLEFKLINKGQLFTLFEDLENRIVDRIYTYSKQFFNGKEFSTKRISQSLGKLVNLDDNGITKVPNIRIDSKVNVYDNFGDRTKLPNFPLYGACIVSLDRIIFDKKNIRVPIKITHIKIKNELDKKKDLECILDDETEAEGGSGSGAKSVSKKNTEDPQELDTVVKDFDNLEFFEE